jgi:hypothetical protein
MARRVRRRLDDHRATRSVDPPLRLDETGNDSWRFKNRADDHTTIRARAASATPTSSDGASANRSKRKTRGALLDANLVSRSDDD